MSHSVTLSSSQHLKNNLHGIKTLQQFEMSCAKKQDYRVVMLEGILDENTDILHDCLNERQIVLITTKELDLLYGEKINRFLQGYSGQSSKLVLALTEAQKTFEAVEAIIKHGADKELDRHAVLVSLGGGVLSDICTLAASLIRRGISHFRIPTTLIGLVDAGIGLKGGVNLKSKKNGAFAGWLIML